MEPRHHRADRHPGDLGDLAIAELVQLAQYDHFAQRRRQRFDKHIETPQIGPALQQRLGIGRSVRRVRASFVVRRLGFERDDVRRAIAFEPAVAGAPYDPQQPALCVALTIGVEIAKRPEHRFLHDIGGIGIVARQPACQRIGGVEMRQHHALEPAATPALGDPRHLLYPAICRTAVSAILFPVPPLQSSLTKPTLRPEGKDEPDGNDRRISHPRATPAAAAEPMKSEAAAATPAAEIEPVASEIPPPAAEPTPAGRRLPPAVWVTGLAAIVILILYFFTGH